MALKMKDGTNLLGAYYGESEDNNRIVLYKPITINLSTLFFNSTPINSYTTNMFFQYGGDLVTIPYTDILHHDIASEFFEVFYSKSLSDLLYLEEEVLHKSYIKFFRDSDIRDAMRGTDSILIDNESKYIQ